MIEENDRDTLINYRINQAHDTITDVTKLIENDLLNVAVNRIYYGIFYCLNALALKYEFQSSKHLQLIGWFNQNFIKTGIFEVKYGRILRNAFKNRSDGDYVPFITFSKDDVVAMQRDMIDMIEQVTAYLKVQ
jgi:uncharacterized protein (UPF0332 family)